MWEENKPRTILTFSYKSYNEGGELTSHIERSLHDDKNEFLPDVLQEFLYFLNGLTYTYIDVISCQKFGGEKVASSAEA
jgi:hypothetical protein